MNPARRKYFKSVLYDPTLVQFCVHFSSFFYTCIGVKIGLNSLKNNCFKHVRCGFMLVDVCTITYQKVKRKIDQSESDKIQDGGYFLVSFSRNTSTAEMMQ